MPGPLCHDFPLALTTLFASIDGHAQAGAPVFPGSPGTVATRRNQHGAEYYTHRYYGVSGKQEETYLGLVGEFDEQAQALRLQIEEAKALAPELRLLIREGYQFADARTYATLAALQRHRLFSAGATLVGSHAFGVILNRLGVRAAAYATEDVDVARSDALAFESMPEKSFLEMLRDSGIRFVDVPQLDHRKPSTSFKQQGMSRFHVDLLVPSPDAEIHIVPVPELKAHATALPYLGYLLGQTQMATLIGREGCCPVRVPLAERFAIHKLLVSQLRTGREAKTGKDIFQASIVLAALGDKHPGAIGEAVAALPVSALRQLRKALPQALAQLVAHPRGAEELEEAVTRRATRTEAD